MPMMFHSEENAPLAQNQPLPSAQAAPQTEAQQGAETQTQAERRYDPDTLRRMTAVATRLQHDHYEKMTAGEMESIGAEVGLKPEFVQQALAQLDAEHAQAEQERQQQEARQATQQADQSIMQGRKTRQQQSSTNKTTRHSQASGTRAEFYSVCAALAAPLLFGLLAYHFKCTIDGSFTNPRSNAIQLFTLIAPVPIALLQGFAAGKRRVGFAAAAALILALAPTVPFLGAVSSAQYQQILTDILSHLPEMMAYSLIGIPIAGAFGIVGAWMRQRYFPFSGDRARDDARATPQNASYPDPQRLQHREYAPMQTAPTPYPNATTTPYAPANNMHLTPNAYAHAYLPYQNAQQQTPYNVAPIPQNTRRAFLSVDVAGLDNLRQSATLAAVDYSFGQLRGWTEEIVRVCGGDVHREANMGLLASFPSEAQAARAARMMHTRLGEFNQTLNRLPVPFRLRCGLSAGDTANNAAVDRSQGLLRMANAGDTLVSSEMGAVALAELGPLTPLPGTAQSDGAFLWRAAQSSPSAA